MANWKKIIYSGSHADLETLRLQGGGTQYVPNPNLDLEGDQNFYVGSLGTSPGQGSQTHDWLTDPANSNGASDWIMNEGSTAVTDQAIPQSNHALFDFSPAGNNGGSGNTGPNYGLPSDTEPDNDMTKAHWGNNESYLHADTSGGQNGPFSIVSPEINLANETNAKLIFYVHMYSSDDDTMGTLRMYWSTSNSSCNAQNPLQLRYVVANGTTWSSNVTSISDRIQTAQASPYNRVEVDLTGETGTGYVWFMYVGASEYRGDIAIANIYFQSDPYPDEILEEIPALRVDSNQIIFKNLPNVDPGIAGRLYRVPQSGPYPDQAGNIKISTG
jgi:hypothetical protein